MRAISCLIVSIISTFFLVSCITSANVDKLFLDTDQYELELYGFSNNDYINIENHITSLDGYKNHKLIYSSSLKKNIVYTSSFSNSRIQKELIKV